MFRGYPRPTSFQLRIGGLTVRQQFNLYFIQLFQQVGRRDGPLKRSTVKFTHALLRQALGEAVRDDMLDSNA